MDTEVHTGADASLEQGQISPEAEAEEIEGLDAESEAESPPAEDQNLDENKDSFQERIDRLTRYRRDAEREAESLRTQWEQAQAELQQFRQQQTTPEPDKTLADFDYNEAEYAAYLRQDAANTAREAARQEAVRIAEEERQRQQFAEKRSKFDAAADKFAKNQSDFYEVTQDRHLPITQEMAEVIMDSDVGPNLAYYLGKHPEEAYKIATMHPAHQGRQLANLETRLRSELSKQAKQASDAPPPPKGKVKGTQPGFKTNPTDASSDKMSDREWLLRREAQLAKKSG